MSAVASSSTNNSSSSSNMTSSASSSLLNSPPVVLPPSLLGGSPECPCIDISPVLYDVANCIVDEYDGGAGTSIPTNTNTNTTSTRNGTYVDVPVSTLKSMLPRAALGVYVKLLGTVDNTYTCVPITYGSQECRQHQLGLHPECQASSSSSVLSPYCYDYFCYVDPIQCKNSQELYGRTRNLQPFDVESGIYYSYTTCRSTDPDNADRLNYRLSLTTTNRVISAVVPVSVRTNSCAVSTPSSALLCVEELVRSLFIFFLLFSYTFFTFFCVVFPFSIFNYYWVFTGSLVSRTLQITTNTRT